MRLLLVHRYFWPDTPPYASMLRSMGSSWSADGHQVSVFTAQPSYKPQLCNPKQASRECVDGIDIVRCRLLGANGRIVSLLNMLLFIVQLMWFIATSRKFDFVIMSTVPQVIGAWCASFVAVLRGARFIYHMQDIHPESAMYSGIITSSLTARFLKTLDIQTCNRSTAVVVLSSDMRSTLLDRDSQLEKKIRIIKNHPMNDYSDENVLDENDLDENDLDGNDLLSETNEDSEHTPFRIVFAGNIGRFQGLNTVVEAGLLLKDNPQVKFVFVGDGKARELLEAQSRPAGKVVEFVGHKSVDEANQVIADANLALISLAPKIHRVAFPSKILSYAKLGIPLLAVVESESELASLVREWKMGICVDVGDSRRLADEIELALQAPEKIKELSKNVVQFGLHTFDVNKINSQWRELLVGR